MVSMKMLVFLYNRPLITNRPFDALLIIYLHDLLVLLTLTISISEIGPILRTYRFTSTRVYLPETVQCKFLNIGKLSPKTFLCH